MTAPSQPSLDSSRSTAEQAHGAWAARVRANRLQVDRYREAPDGDFYGPVASLFRADPHRTDEPTLEVLRGLLRPEDVVLDIGAGGGRYALPLALTAREVIAVEPSEGMLGVLREGMVEHGIANVRPLQARWPIPVEQVPSADVALISHVGYDVEQIGPFLDAMERAARRLCVAVLLERQPTFAFDALWPEIHGVERDALPSLPEFLHLLLARGTLFEVRLTPREPQAYPSREDVLGMARRQLWVQPDGAKDQRLRALLHERAREQRDRYSLAWEPISVGVVSWSPGDGVARTTPSAPARLTD